MYVSEKMCNDWAGEYTYYEKNNMGLSYPAETLVRLFKGDYLTGNPEKLEGKSVLDVGFGNGNNTIFLSSLGLDTYGIEIHQSICDELSKRMQKAGVPAELKVGSNQAIPFPDNSFDYLVSWNVLHYEGTEKGVVAGIKEYSRVLKPGGRLILSTTGPTHKILKNARIVGDHSYEIGRSNDFRKGQTHFFFDTPMYIEHYFNKFFSELQIGRIEDKLFDEKLDWWLVTGIKE